MSGPQDGGSPTTSGYMSNPMPTQYNSTFGGIPGPINIPDPFTDLSRVLPGLSGLNQQVSGDLASQLGGQLSPATINLLQDQAAAWGVKSGMPGSGLAQNRGLRDLGLTAENVINQGLQNYKGIIPTISGTQTVSPTLQAEIASRNAAMQAAPNPASAQSYAAQLFNKYLQQMRGPGGGSGGMGSPSGGTLPSGFGGSMGGTPSSSSVDPWASSDPYSGSFYPDWAQFDSEQMMNMPSGWGDTSGTDGGYYEGLTPSQSDYVDQFWSGDTSGEGP